LSRPFRFEEFWTKDPTCGDVIDVAWNLVVSGNPALCLVKKLNYTKTDLKNWNSLHFGNIQNKIKASLFKIDQA
jgi:hypothetical protein